MSEGQKEHHLDEHHEDYYDILANQKITMRDLTDHMTGPVISGVIHIILIAFLSSIIVFEPAEEKDEIEVEMTDMEIKPMEEPPEPPEPPEEVETDEVEVEIERPDVDPGPPAEAPVADINVNDSALQVDVSDIMGGGLLMEGNNSALTLNVGDTFKMRSVTGRAKALSKYGVSAEADKAVTKALDYFQRIQLGDGSWGSPAMTALAILCYLAHGDTPDSEQYGETVMKGIRKLVAYSKIKAGADRNIIAKGGNGYGHAMVTYALAEAYALTKIPMVKEAMNDMVLQVIKGMNVNGSYDYNFKQEAKSKDNPKKTYVRSDLSLAGWCYQAMKAAYAAGCDVKGLEKSIERSIKGLKITHRAKDGGFSYGGGKTGGGINGKNTMTAVGVLCLQLLGEGKSPEAKMGLKWFENKKYIYPSPHKKSKDPKHPAPKETLKKESLTYLDCNWEKAPSGSLYQWYYMTQALFQASTTKAGSPKAWKKWNASFTKTLIENQNPNGSWDDPAVKNPRIHVHGPKKGVFPTALCTLMLEVYYRYLPTFKLHGGSHGKSHKVKDDAEDLGITF